MRVDPATGLLAGARFLPSPNQDERPAGAEIELLVVHGISLPPGEFGGPWIDALFTNALDPAAHPYFAAVAHLRVAAHVLIRRGGEIVQYVPFHRRAWHAGESAWRERERCNDFSIGIELEGADDVPYTGEQYAALAALARALFAVYPRLAAERIAGHSEIAPGRKTDPGPAFDWARLRRELAAGVSERSHDRMRVFLTGATGYIGGAVAAALAGAGHEVLALAHSDRAEAAIRARGWTPARGDLREPASLAAHAGDADAAVHAAHTGGADAADVDTAAVHAMLDALAGSGKPFVYTSGVWVLGDTGGFLVDEEAATDRPAALSAWRAALEPEVTGAAGRGVRAVVIRPGVVYGRGGGLPGMLARGELPVVGDGRQRWPLVHLDDLADLYLRALEAPAGSLLHGTDGWAAMIELALAGRAGAGAGGALERLDLAAARARLGAFADALALDQRVASDRTRRLTGWSPRAMPVIEELLAGSYRAGDV